MLPLVWCASFFEPTGYSDEARGLTAALDQLGAPVVIRNGRPESPGFRETLPSALRTRLERILAKPLPSSFIQLQHSTIDGFAPFHEHAVYRIGRSMFETDGLPSTWVALANQLDELWVPSEFNVETFRRAGVTCQMHVVPGGIAAEEYHPDVSPMAIAGARGTVFLSVFEWRRRKGWDTLLRGWATAFTQHDDATLVIRSYPASKVEGQSNTEILNAQIDEFLHSIGRSRDTVAPIVVIGEKIPARDLPSLYAAASAFVLPTHGEGWGRPFMEAMASAVPVIATRWSAHLAFMNDDNSYLIDTNGLTAAIPEDVPYYAGQRWANPDATHLAQLLRTVHADPDAARARGRRARTDMQTQWPWSHTAGIMRDRIMAIEAQLAATRRSLPGAKEKANVLIVGGTGTRTAPRQIAPQWVDALADLPASRVQWRPTAELPCPSFGTPAWWAWQYRARAVNQDATRVLLLDADQLRAPTIPAGTGHLVVDASLVCRDGVPPECMPLLRDEADVVVVGDLTAADTLASLGVSPERLAVVPFAVDSERLATSTATYMRRSRSATTFLTFGGALGHRGLQRLVLAFERTFTRDDDVGLHIVLQPPIFGEDLAWRERLISQAREGTRDARLPPLWIDVSSIDTDEMPALYRSASVFVQAGRALTAGNSIREAMACGVPVIVTDTPFARTLVTEETGWLIPAGTSGFADVSALQHALREAADANERSRRSRAALDAAATWPSPATRQHTLRSLLQFAAPPRAMGVAAPADTVPFVLEEPRRLVILAHANWHDGEVERIVRSYLESVSSQDDVSLALCLDPAQGVDVDGASERLGSLLTTRDDAADLLLVTDILTERTLHGLRTRADAVVSLRPGAPREAARVAGRPLLDTLDRDAWQSLLRRLSSPEPSPVPQ